MDKMVYIILICDLKLKILEYTLDKGQFNRLKFQVAKCTKINLKCVKIVLKPQRKNVREI